MHAAVVPESELLYEVEDRGERVLLIALLAAALGSLATLLAVLPFLRSPTV